MRAQLSTEFMMVVIIVLVFILGTYIVAFGREGAAQQHERQQKLDSVCNNIATRINNAANFGFGFRQNYSLPETIDGASYTIDVSNKSLSCRTDRLTSIQIFNVEDITNSTNIPPFSIPIREIKIENDMGTVVIS